MKETPKSHHVLGLDIDNNLLQGALLSEQRGQPVIDAVFEISLESISEEGNVKPLYIESLGSTIAQVIKKYLSVTSLHDNETLVRSMEMKLKKEKDIDAVLAFQAEPLLPYPIENAVVDRIILEQAAGGTVLTLLAARKDHVSQHIAGFEKIGIETEVVTATAASLTAYSRLLVSTLDPYYILHLGMNQTVCVLVNNGKLIGAQTCSQNLNKLVSHLTTQTSAETLNWNLLPETEADLQPLLESLRIEIIRTLFSLTKQLKGREIFSILVTGEGALFPGLAETLLERSRKEILTPDHPADNLSRPQYLKYAIPIGNALNALSNNKHPINFRQQELAFPDPWRRLKQPLMIYFASCIGLAVAMLFFAQAYISQQTVEVRRDYVELLSSMKKPFSAFETEYVAKNPKEVKIDNPVNLSMDELEKRVQLLENEIKSSPDIYPLYPNVPRVSDVLAWLSNHANVVKREGKNPEQLIQIDSFSYNYVKRPELNKTQEKYQVKVQIEFTSPIPRLAREFHDALIAPNDLVDPKGEVKWSTNKGKYRASFFLKDKTPYPGKGS